MMKKNMGQTDKWIRIIVGLALIAVLFIVQSGWRWIGLVGFVMVGTALINFCPLYTLFGIHTNKEDNR